MSQRTHDSQRISDQVSQPKSKRREYDTPHLIEYGDLRQLTAGGNKGNHENGTGGASTRA